MSDVLTVLYAPAILYLLTGIKADLADMRRKMTELKSFIRSRYGK